MKNSLGIICSIALLSVLGLWACLTPSPPAALEVADGFNDAPTQRRRSSDVPHGPLAQRLSRIELLIENLKKSSLGGFSSEERMQMARDLNSAYFESSSNVLRKRISDALTLALYGEKDQQVARAIVFSHSRISFDENTLPNLKYAYGRKIIFFDDYYGELAHSYVGAPQSVRLDLIKEISGSHNRYAVDIIAGGIAFEEKISLSKDEASESRRFLTANEPIFSGSADAFGYFEAILYNQWLIAVARLQNENNGVSVEQFLGDKLLNPSTDPRASVAFLISAYAKNIKDSQRVALQWDSIEARARELMRQNPHSSGLQQIGREMAK